MQGKGMNARTVNVRAMTRRMAKVKLMIKIKVSSCTGYTVWSTGDGSTRRSTWGENVNANVMVNIKVTVKAKRGLRLEEKATVADIDQPGGRRSCKGNDKGIGKCIVNDKGIYSCDVNGEMRLPVERNGSHVPERAGAADQTDGGDEVAQPALVFKETVALHQACNIMPYV
jgi:hypothetical protein